MAAVTTRGRWRAFRHDAGLEAGPPAAGYVLLYLLCLLIGHWSATTFQAVIVWPTNGVLLAAYLQLPRRRAAIVLALCFGLNLVSAELRGDAPPFVWINPLLNLGQAVIAGLLARRLCGAALDMRRPRRVLLFALGAAGPAVAATTTIGVLLAVWFKDYSLTRALFTWRHLFMMEMLGLLIMTPSLLLLARAHRFRDEASPPWEIVSVLALTAGTFIVVFSQSSPFLFMVFPPLMLAAYRLSPPWMAITLLAGVTISGLMTMVGSGPVSASTVPYVAGLEMAPLRLRQMPLYYGFLLVAALTALPISALMAERRANAARLARRTALALEQRRRAEEAVAAKSRFLAVMSHEMRTPLNGISGYADLLSRRGDLAPDAQAQVAAIREAGGAMLLLVEDVLDASRGQEAAEPEPIAVEPLIREVCESAAAAAAAKSLVFDLAFEGAAGEHRLGDRRRLGAALRHLLSNAVKFTDSGQVRVRISLEDERLAIEVADTGPGIAPSLRPSLFDIFAQGDDSLQRRHGGAGVGLSAARLHARAMGGDVVLSETSAGGSVFILTARLARLSEAQALRLEAEEEAGAVDRPLRALIVDDHPANRRMLRIMMEAAGAQAVEAVDGYEAVDKAASGAFDLILMDVRMPRLDGLEATRRIRRQTGPSSAAVILAVTADAMPEDAARCLAAGMDGHLAKPLTHERLFAAVEQAFRAAAVRASADAA
ncbi:hybrid sensor histidine kinase/response regulator [Brevundimonas naejangsanensis]|uniref:hybrid sensor histidine kinase/response regulator n=1 Tax=Brevundimonas naejangsanensis TaxID=588932 RepID=UPI0013C53797|nr:response regulator [Brevundimonas naejangsanensis]